MCPVNKMGAVTLCQTSRHGSFDGARRRCKGNWIKASVERDGRFTIVTGRNGFSKTYTAR